MNTLYSMLAASVKQQILELIERVPEAELVHMDPVRRSLLLAPADDEPVTAEEERMMQEAMDDPRPLIPHEEILREFGL